MVAVPTLTGASPSDRPLSPLVLGLVRVLMLFTSDSDGEWDVPNARWREASQFLGCSVSLLRRMHKIGLAASDAKRHVRGSALGCALLDTLASDRAFSSQQFEALPRGARAACAIYQWVVAYAQVSRLQSVLPDRDGASVNDRGGDDPHDSYFVVTKELSARERALERTEAKDNAISEEATARHFVPRELLSSVGDRGNGPRSSRTRAVVVVVGRDLPTRAKRSVLGRLMAALPGRFVVINRCRDDSDGAKSLSMVNAPGTRSITTVRGDLRAKTRSAGDYEVPMFDVGAVRAAVALGYSVVLEADIGLRDPTRRRFLSAFAAVKAAIHPSPHCVLLQSSARNRPEPVDDREEGGKKLAPATACDQSDQNVTIADADLKTSMEAAAEHLFSLSQRQVAMEMLAMSSASDAAASNESPKAPAALVIAMEAVIVLLTPGKTYTGPSGQLPVVSWRLARRLLANPRFLQLKLAQVRADAVPRDNLAALDRYIGHPTWPTRHHALSLQPRSVVSSTSGDIPNGGAHLVFALAAWVEATVSLAHMIADGNGIAGDVTRSSPVLGLFGGVITYCNAGKSDAAHDVAFDDDTPVNDVVSSADAVAAGESSATRELLEASLADACVYRAAHALYNGERCVVSVFHDCQRIFFSAYAPSSSRRWLTAISESHVDALLAPNSLERVDAKRPPATRSELYDRLVRLCVLQSGGYSADNALVGDNSRSLAMGNVSLPAALDSTAQLVVRPRAVRLLHRVMRIGGFLATVTLSELSRGRVQVDAFIHSSDSISGVYSDGHRRLIPSNSVGSTRTVVGLESILERMSADRARHVAAVSPPRLASMVLDRLHMFYAMQSRSKRSNACGRGRRAIPAVVAHQLLASCASNPAGDACSRALTVRIRVRTKERAPGRVLVRRAVRLPRDRESSCDGNGAKEPWLLSVVEMHVERSFAAQLYHPRSSRRLEVALSARDLQDFVRVSRFTSQSRLQQCVARVFRFTFSSGGDDDDTEDEDDAGNEDGDVEHVKQLTKQITPVTRRVDGLAVRRVLTRFPAALLHSPVPHHLVPKTTRRVRVYVQVESCEADTSERGFLFRVYEPESCEEHALTIRDCEIETWMEENRSWARASTEQRAHTSRQLVRSTFEWCGDHDGAGRVTVRLPSGVIPSCRASRQLRSGLNTSLDQHATAMSTGPTGSDVQVAPSCVVLLDEDDPEREDVMLDADYSAPRPSKWCFHCDKEELVHRGTHRTNGQLLVVQVLMKAAIRERLVPLVPKDRVLQKDALVITFKVYHPSTSSHATAVIDGRRDLREVVGPDKASLISSSSVQALICHIVEARTEALLVDPDVEAPSPPVSAPSVMREYREREQRRRRRELRVMFLRDRLFAKQKATPITCALEGDAEVNAVKLIDHASERGVKVLSRAKVLAGCGRVILTFFDVAGRYHSSGSSDRRRRWRVDAYVCATSERLSLMLEPTDLLHVVGDRVKLLRVGAADCEPTEGDEPERQRCQRELALVVIDHVGIEQRRDGRCSRLFLSEYFFPPPPAAKNGTRRNPDRRQQRELLFKAVRAVDDTQVVLAMYPDDEKETSVQIELYEPSTSASSSLELSLPTLAAMLGLPEDLARQLVAGDPKTTEAAGGLPRSAVMAHLSSFIRVSKRSNEADSDSSDQFHQRQDEVEAALANPALVLDQKQARACADRFFTHRGDHDGSASDVIEASRVLQRWMGAAVGFDSRYLAVHLHLKVHQDKYALLCSAYSPASQVVATSIVDAAKVEALALHKLHVSLPPAVDTFMDDLVAPDLLQRISRCLRVELVEQLTGGDDDTSYAEMQSDWRLRIQLEL